METIKTYAVLLLAITTMGLTIYSNHLRRELKICKAPRPPMPAMGTTDAEVSVVPSIDTYTDAAGKQHAVITNTTLGEISRKRALDLTGPFRQVIDSQAVALQVKPKQVESYLAVQLKVVRDSLRFAQRTIAENGMQTRTFKDPYLTLIVRDGLPADSAGADSLGGFDLDYNADLKFVEYSRQRRFLGIPISLKRFYTDISSSDPRLRIKGVEKFTIQRSEPAFGLRVQALSTYNFETESWGAGIGTRLDVGDKFNAGVNYLYNFNLLRWIPTAYAKYDIWQIGR